ncbi:MAG: V-type ATP synthase subunit D [Eubacteriales bacterium]
MKVRDLVAKAAAIENSVYRLAKAIKQSQKRANALKNIVIPDLEEQIHYITGYLEEKERDEFTTLKVVKGRK